MRDSVTNEVITTGFSAASRRYNALFCLAAHEVQASNAEKEVRLDTPFAPSNIRIHGTMYRRVLAMTETNPIRYLVVDPAQRQVTAKDKGLNKTTVMQLENLFLPHNVLMTNVRQLLRQNKKRRHVRTFKLGRGY